MGRIFSVQVFDFPRGFPVSFSNSASAFRIPKTENLKPETRNLKSTEWTFTSAEAVRRQKDTAPAGGVTLTIPLAEDQPQPPPVSARYVRVAAGPARWLSIAEAEVLSDGKNIARGKPASQSSTYGTAHAGLAVDGQTEGVFSRGSVGPTTRSRTSITRRPRGVSIAPMIPDRPRTSNANGRRELEFCQARNATWDV